MPPLAAKFQPDSTKILPRFRQRPGRPHMRRLNSFTPKSDLIAGRTRERTQSVILEDMESRMQRMAAVCDIAQKTIQYLDHNLSQRLSELVANSEESLNIIIHAARIYPCQAINHADAPGGESPQQHELFDTRITVIHDWAESGCRWVHDAQKILQAWLEDQQVHIRRLERQEIDLKTSNLDRQYANFGIDFLVNAFEDISINMEQEIRLPKVCQGGPIGINHSSQIQIQNFPYLHHDVNEYQAWPENERKPGWTAHTLYINLYDLALRSGLL